MKPTGMLYPCKDHGTIIYYFLLHAGHKCGKHAQFCFSSGAHMLLNRDRGCTIMDFFFFLPLFCIKKHSIILLPGQPNQLSRAFIIIQERYTVQWCRAKYDPSLLFSATTKWCVTKLFGWLQLWNDKHVYYLPFLSYLLHVHDQNGYYVQSKLVITYK